MINRTVILSFLLAVFMANMLYAEEEKKESDWDTTALPAVFYDIVGIYDNVLYAVTNDNALCAFNNNTGDILWKYNMPANYMLNLLKYVIMKEYIVILSYTQRFPDMFKDETIVSVIDKSNGSLLRRATATRQNGEALKGVAGVYGKYIVCQGTVFAKDARATIYDIENMRIIFDENGDLFMWDKYICKCLSTAEIEIVYDLELGTEYKREIHLESPLSGYFICVGNKIVTMYDWKDTAVTRSDYSILIMSMNGKLIDRLEVKGCQKLVMTNKDSKRLILEGDETDYHGVRILIFEFESEKRDEISVKNVSFVPISIPGEAFAMGTDKYIVFSKDFREKLLIFAKTENDVACWYYGNTNIFGYSKIIEENGKTIYRKQIVALKHIIKKIECMAENINARKVEELHFPALRRG